MSSSVATKRVWKKLGHVYQPSGELPWARTHAANPVPEHIEGDLFRVYFSARDEQNRSSIGSVVIDLKEPNKIIEESKEPVLGPGELAMFDDSGASIGCILRQGDVRFLYYMGWNLSVTVPWKNAIGLAISEAPGKPFKRYSTFPIVPLSEIDPYTISYPWVLKEGDTYRMWYGSNLKWGAEKADMMHIIKYAESKDGIHWERPNRIVIDSEGPHEYAICKPCVLKVNPGSAGVLPGTEYIMWFCTRGERYRIHWAKSKDGVNWERLGQDPGIDVSPTGWDSDMIEYPCVIEHKGKQYLFYCGSEYGKTGFGVAELTDFTGFTT